MVVVQIEDHLKKILEGENVTSLGGTQPSMVEIKRSSLS